VSTGILPAVDRVRTTHAARSADELLRERVGALLGVSAAAESALATLNVHTVFDLAASRLFAAATRVVSLAGTAESATVPRPFRAVPADVVAVPSDVPVEKLAFESIAILRQIGPANAAAISAALGVTTVRDLALWPPYLSAREILAEAFFPAQQVGFDREAPLDLLPQTRVHPTERVFYTRLLIDAPVEREGELSPIEQADALDVVPAILNPAGLQRLATGALLTFSQSWFSQGLTLGQLLHSMALAPGESTRVAMVDWTRRSRAATGETISETEDVSSEQTHTRALSEVTNATATELQTGTSRTQATSKTSESGSGFGFEAGPLAFGGSGGSSTTKTEAMSASSSFGTRDLSSSFAQNINDRSQQHASAARTRRASIVREVSQEERETISTRVVTNYNHMHALTVQYYEVVQAFRVTTQLERAERCLFVPFKLINFRDTETLERWRFVLAGAALTREAARQLAEFGTVLVTSQQPRAFPTFQLVRPATSVLSAAIKPTAENAAQPAPKSNESSADGDAAPNVPAEPPAAQPRIVAAALSSPIARMAAAGWDLAQLNRLRGAMGRFLLPTRTNSIYVSDDALVTGFTLKSGNALGFDVTRHDGSDVTLQQPSPTSASFAAPISIRELASIAIRNASITGLTTGLTLHLNISGTAMPLDVPILLPAGGPLSAFHECVRFDGGRSMRDLMDHLEAHRLHYSQAIFQSLDGAAIATLLAGFTFRGLPLGQLVDHQPVAVSANCLVFKMNLPESGAAEDRRLAGDLEAWRTFLKRAGLDAPAPRSQIIPLPSGGVFAEAVLGRFNAAERIDLERFWNWQDSPIPLTAPEIAAIKAGSRAEAETLTPGQLSAPIVNIQTPTALPDPTGIAALAGALQNPNVFRDMSGLAETAALAQAAQKTTASAATAAMQQAGENLFTVMDQKTQRMRIAAQLAAQMAGVPVAGDTGSKSAPRGNATQQGGELREARTLDEKNASGGGATQGAETEVFRSQTGAKARELAGKVADAALAGGDDATEGVVSAPPARGVTPKQAAPQALLAVLNLSNRFMDPAVFGPTPVQIEATIQSLDGRKVWSQAGPAARTFSAPIRTSEEQLFLNLVYTYQLSWPQPTTVNAKSFVHLSVPAAATRIDAVAWVLVDERTVTLSDATAPANDAALAEALKTQGIDLLKVLSKPTVSPHPGGGFDVAVRLLRVTMEQLSSPPGPA
jgi:hypothetical protein